MSVNCAKYTIGCKTIDRVGQFYLPTKSLDKYLLYVIQKSGDFVSR